MKKNVGNADRIIRLMVAGIFMALFFTGTITGTLGYVLITLSAVFVLTSWVGYCPVYTLIGLNTCQTRKI